MAGIVDKHNTLHKNMRSGEGDYFVDDFTDTNLNIIYKFK